MANNQTSHVIKTKLTKNQAEPSKTELVIEWDATEEQLRELATRSVVIAVQSNYRAAENIPAKDTVKVSELFTRTPRTAKAMTPEAIANKAKADPAFLEELKKLLKAYHTMPHFGGVFFCP